MYQGFSITTIQPSYANKSIMVTTSFDIDSTSVNDSTIKVFSKNDRADVDIDFVVDKKIITILLRTEIVPNTEYILRITNGVTNVLGDGLSSGVRRTVVFSSEIEKVPIIMSPSNYEEVNKVSVSLGTGADKTNDDADMYFIQIARDVAFIEMVLETTTDRRKTDLKALENGQYYIRARVERVVDDKRMYGKWSEVVTFISFNKGQDSPGDTEDIFDPSEPEYFEEITIIDKPINGETPESILIEFSGEIDPDFIDNIIVIRRDI